MKKTLLLISILGLSLASCKKDPIACFELDSNIANTTTPIRFTSCSENTLSYLWSFSGPVGAPENVMQFSEPIIERTFSVPGTYTVQLEAFTNYSWVGEMSTTTTTFTIN